MRKHWGWGNADQALTAEQIAEAAPGIATMLGLGRIDVEQPVELAEAVLPQSRVEPGDLSDLADDGAHARATHAMGKAYRDVVRAFRGDFSTAPDFVARPGTATSRSSPTVAARASWGEWNRVGSTISTACSAWILGGWTGCSRWTRCPGRRGSQPERPVPCWRNSCANTD